MEDNTELDRAVNDNNESAAPLQPLVPSTSLEPPSVRRRGAIGSLPIDTINLIRLSNFSLYPEGNSQNEFSTEELRAGSRRPHYLRRRRSKDKMT